MQLAVQDSKMVTFWDQQSVVLVERVINLANAIVVIAARAQLYVVLFWCACSKASCC